MIKSARDPRYRRHQFLADVIAQAVWLYFRFPLSLRMVEDMLSARGIIVSHETVRRWAEKFGRDFAGEIRRRAPQFGDKWYLDEVVLTINRSTDKNTGSGAPLIRTASCSMHWSKAAAISDQPSG